MSIDYGNIAFWTATSLFLYTVYGVIYRLYLSPIARFPGPKLAAVTFWFEFYYDVVLTGQYIWKIRELHEKYGPVVRINPRELHILDPDYFDVMYSNDRNADKWEWGTRAFGAAPECILATSSAQDHRMRRAPLNGYFSTQKAMQLRPVVKERIDKLVERFAEFANTDQSIKLETAFAAMSNDIIMKYTLGKHDAKLEAKNFDPEWHDMNKAGTLAIPTMKHLSFIITIVSSLPEWLMEMLNPAFVGINLSRKGLLKQIEAIASGSEQFQRSESYGTMFHDLFDSKLPEKEKNHDRLADEAQLVIAAGTGTVAWTLTIACFYLLSTPSMLRRLKDELHKANSDGSKDLSVQELQALPYLSAIVNEALRHSHGATHRLQRVFPNPIEYRPSHLVSSKKSWTIPAGTPVSQCIPLSHYDAEVFPEPLKFIPERWIKDPSLTRYQFAWSRGARRCLGMNLGISELFTCLHSLFSQFGSAEVRDPRDLGILELVDTDVSDVELWGDCFLPKQKPGSQGVKILVKS